MEICLLRFFRAFVLYICSSPQGAASGSGKDGAGPNDQDMSGLPLRVYYYCSPGDFMLITTYMYRPHVGLHGGWGTLVTNQT